MVANNSIDLIDQNETSIIIGAGKGHLSTVSLYEDKNLVRKIPITEPSKVLAVPLKQERFQTMHNTELIIYEILKNHHEANISHPKIFDSQEMNVKSNVTGYLLMEYISGCEHVYLFENLNPEHLIEPIKQIARFHAIKLSENEQGKVPKNMLTSWMAELFCEANMEQFMSVWRNYMKNYMSSETLENAELLPKIMQMENFQRWNDDLTLPQVLCHGDFTPPNIMFEKDTRTFKSICDYQTSNIGNGMQDLARLLATSLSGQNRRKHTENLLKVYHEEIQKHISYQIDFEKIIESYEIFFVLHSAVCCSTSPGSILRRLNESTDEQFKQQISDVMWEKYTLLLEDMAIYWNYHF